MAGLINLRAASLALLTLSSACGPEPRTQVATEINADACKSLRLSEPALRDGLFKAERGDVSAERNLWDHYSCTDDRKAAYWEQRLVQRGDAAAMGGRSSKLFLAATRLGDSEPNKVILLKQAVDLEARARKAIAGRVDRVMVNGESIEVRYSGEPDEATSKLQRELARVVALKQK